MRRDCRERFPHHRLQRKPLVSDPSMHPGMGVTPVPWCMSGSLSRGGGETVPGIPGACATRNFTYLVRGPCTRDQRIPVTRDMEPDRISMSWCHHITRWRILVYWLGLHITNDFCHRSRIRWKFLFSLIQNISFGFALKQNIITYGYKIDHVSDTFWYLI